jgi:hypothetical protein
MRRDHFYFTGKKILTATVITGCTAACSMQVPVYDFNHAMKSNIFQ